MTKAIVIQDVRKSFPTESDNVMALRGIDLAIEDGEFLLLVGPSGCGKTTLISIIAGILRPDSGQCSVYGHDFAALSEVDIRHFRAQNIGFIFQAFNLIPTLSIVENVAVPLLVGGMNHLQAESHARDILERVGLGHRMAGGVNRLSGGEQQRVSIARALVHKPTLIICDEPTSALDHSTGESIMTLMKSINQEIKTTFVVVTHDARIYSFADRIVKMDDGIIVD